MNTEALTSQYQQRQMRLLGIIKDDSKDSFFTKSNYVPIGTYEPFYEYGGVENMSDRDWYWIPIKDKTHSHTMIAAQAGNLKSTLLKILVPFDHHHGVKQCIIEGKDDSFTRAKKVCAGSQIVYKEAQPIALPIYSICPSYLISSSKSAAYRLGVENFAKNANAVVSLNTKTIKSSAEWKSILGTQPTGSDVLHQINAQCENIMEIKQLVNKGYYKMLTDGKTITASIQHATKESLKIKIQNFIEDEVFDVKQSKRFIVKGAGYEGSALSVPDVWEMGLLPEIPFFRRNPEYMRLYAKNLMEQEALYAEALKTKTQDSKVILHNRWDDAQLIFNNNDENIAVQEVLNSMHNLRYLGLSNTFCVQNLSEIHPAIVEACTDFFIGYVNTLGSLKIEDDAREKVELNRNKREQRGQRVYVPYLHITQDNPKGTTFYPADPLCGGWG
jgi:hypothetical protein